MSKAKKQVRDEHRNKIRVSCSIVPEGPEKERITKIFLERLQQGRPLPIFDPSQLPSIEALPPSSVP